MNLSVVQHIALGFAILVTINLANSYYAWRGQLQIKEQYNRIDQDIVPLRQELNEQVESLLLLNRVVTQYMSEDNADRLERLEEMFSALQMQWNLSVGNSSLSDLLSAQDIALYEQTVLDVGAVIDNAQELFAGRLTTLQNQQMLRSLLSGFTQQWARFDGDIETIGFLLRGNPVVGDYVLYVRRLGSEMDMAVSQLLTLETLPLVNNAAVEQNTRVSEIVGMLNAIGEEEPRVAGDVTRYAAILEALIDPVAGAYALQVDILSAEQARSDRLARIEADVDLALTGYRQIVHQLQAANLKASSEAFTTQTTVQRVMWLLTLFAVTVAVFVAYGVARVIRIPLQSILSALERLQNGDLSKPEFGSVRENEFGKIQQRILNVVEHLQGIVLQIRSGSDSVDRSVKDVIASSQNATRLVQEQQHKTAQMEIEITEMERAIDAVTNSANTSLAEVSVMNQRALENQRQMTLAVSSIGELKTSLAESSTVIESLSAESERIRNIVTVIQKIAEQTNLLALNAAIEAARAGDQGRGFAVVADEVRTLAQRTRSATEDIDEMVQALRLQTVEAVEHMTLNGSKASVVVEHAESTALSLAEMLEGLTKIDHMVHSIASAAEQQSHAAKSVSTHVVEIAQTASEVSSIVLQSGDSFAAVATTSDGLMARVSHFQHG